MTVALENLGSLITLKDGNHERCLGYLWHAEGHGTFDANLGRVDVSKDNADIHNKLLDDALLKGLDENCQVGQCGTFYVGQHEGRMAIRTFIGTVVSTGVKANGQTLTFRRMGKTFRGRMSRQHDLFNFRRVA